MTDRDIMQQALEALEDVPYMSNKDDYERLERVKTALRQALETKREWVGLTDEEIQDLGYLAEKFDASNSEWFDRWGFACAIEKALKEKNT